MKGGIKPSELKKKIWFKVKIGGGGGTLHLSCCIELRIKLISIVSRWGDKHTYNKNKKMFFSQLRSEGSISLYVKCVYFICEAGSQLYQCKDVHP